MLRNMVFDMGNVLIKYDPPYFIERAGVEDPEDRALLLKEIFQSADWPLMDSGELTEADLLQRVCLRLPQRLHSMAHYLIYHWDKPLEPIEGMADFVRECKEAGLGIYLLSNASYRQTEYWRNIPCSQYFDGVMVSAYMGYVKPMPQLFEALMNQYNLKAGECLFVDDMPENVKGAERVGMKGFHFTGDVSALRRQVFQLREDGSDAQ